ncbi:DUF3159 domain-containing protein [Actinotalea sp. AC32]|nr:DUF3159 domain-containing protein [Actinotalea sp. AC32]
MSHHPAVDARRHQHPGTATAAPGPTTAAEPTPGPRHPSASTAARRALGMPDLAPESAARAAARRTLERVGGPVGLAVAAAPVVAFVATDAAAGLGPAVFALGLTALAGAAVRVARREPTGAAVGGVVVAAVCAAVAALAGEARAFFLPTMALPAVFVVAYLVAFAAGRPLAGLMVNRVAGGPRDWVNHPALRRVYLVSSLIGLAMASANLIGRVAFYLADEPGALAAIQVGAMTAFALHFAVTLVVARRADGGSTAVELPAPAVAAASSRR